MLALLGATLAVRLSVALADYRSLIGLDIYQDDAFYCLKLAQNLVRGRGVTFDGVMPSNGFHPLYLILLLPILESSTPWSHRVGRARWMRLLGCESDKLS